MKILIFTPVWQRPEVFLICLEGIKRLTKIKEFEWQPFFIISEEWPEKVLKKNNFDYIKTQNSPLGAKKNKGLEYVMENFQFDYLLEIGSDDIITNEYIEICKPYIKSNIPHLLGDSIYFIDIYTGKTSFYRTNKIFGCGRFIKKTAITAALQYGSFWDSKAHRGMDTYSSNQLLKADINYIKIELSTPCLLDIKSKVNINTIHKFPHCEKSADEILNYFEEKKAIFNLMKYVQQKK